MKPARSWARHVGPWFWAKALILLLGAVDVVADSRFTRFLVSTRPGSPQGPFVVPFNQHGGVYYITPAERWTNIALIAGGFVAVLAYWSVEHFEKRAKTR